MRYAIAMPGTQDITILLRAAFWTASDNFDAIVALTDIVVLKVGRFMVMTLALAVAPGDSHLVVLQFFHSCMVFTSLATAPDITASWDQGLTARWRPSTQISIQEQQYMVVIRLPC